MVIVVWKRKERQNQERKLNRKSESDKHSWNIYQVDRKILERENGRFKEWGFDEKGFR